MPTHWDKIYKSYQHGGEAYASLSHEILPAFIKFISNSNFSVHSVLDIGIGDGKYLKFLKANNFKITGIDNSEIAIRMCRRKLGTTVKIILADMYHYRIPRSNYDLIISIATLQHGFKKQIEKLVTRIYSGLVKGGKIFITLPRAELKNKRQVMKSHRELVPGTITPITGPEAGLPHSIYKRIEIKKLFYRFHNLSIKQGRYQCWNVVAEK